MKILSSSSFSNKDLNNFSKQLCGGNCTVVMGLTIFEFEGNSNNFTLDNLRSIYQNKTDEIAGNTKKISFNLCEKEINKILQYSEYREVFSNAKVSPIGTVSPNVFQQRKDTFWTIVNKHMKTPPEIVYEHIPEHDSLFGDFMMWGFCYILLKDGKGLVLHAGASD